MTTPVARAAAAATGPGPVTRAARKKTAPRAGAPRAGAPRRTAPAAPAAPAPRPVRAPRKPARRPAGRAQQFAPLKLPGSGAGSRGVIVAEFAACVVLIGITPVVMRKPDQDGHLYVPNDFVRLTAVSLVFFVLALAANTPKAARASAAFGVLVLLGTAFNARQSFAAIGKIFTATGKPGGATASAKAGTAAADAPVYTPVDLRGNPQGGAPAPHGGAA